MWSGGQGWRWPTLREGFLGSITSTTPRESTTEMTRVHYTDYVRSQSAGSESSEEEVAGQDRDYVVDSNGYVIPA